MSTAPEMLKSVSGIDVNALIKGLTSKTIAAPPAVNKAVEIAAPSTPTIPKLPDLS
jgi:flotillin